MICCNSRIRILAAAAVVAAAAMSALAQSGGLSTSAGDQAVNQTCPISGEPVDGKTFTTYKGRKIGFCCAGCIRAFERWDDGRKDNFVTAALGAVAGDGDSAAKPQVDKPSGEPEVIPYLLDTCPISGGKLGSMGDPVVRVYDGREVRFCCAGCIKAFEAEKEKNFAKIDEQMIKQQSPYYPLDTCVVGGGKLGSMGKPVDFMYANRLVRFCCAGCKPRFEAEPDKYLKMIDQAVIDKQKKDYPLDTCVVMGGKLGSMGEPIDAVVANRLVRLCCDGCLPKLKKDPAKYFAMIDKARKVKGGLSGNRR
ncbi:MAG: hypothetical protein JSV91_06625 [Phycisphaerales bacterium]|nr:MAG: hypothetical protein JSV91_06625 [Phycisphaerales bacterium]